MLQFQVKFGVGGRYPKNPQTRQYILSKQLSFKKQISLVKLVELTSRKKQVG